jgi:hypothetical protein
VAFSELLHQAKSKRETAAGEFITHVSGMAPVFEQGQALQVFFMSDHHTQVLQFVARNLAKAFRKIGHETQISIEQNDMKELGFCRASERVHGLQSACCGQYQSSKQRVIAPRYF